MVERLNGFIDKVRGHIANGIRKRGKQIICLFAIVISILNLVYVSPSYGALDYASAIGENKALNSPLVEPNVSTDDFDTWEMECFAVFLSNFCQPFVDSYESAFTSNSEKGTKGAGLNALKFAAGGDVNSASILQNMTTWIINNSTNVSPIYTQFNIYDFNSYNEELSKEINKTKNVAGTTGKSRQAVLGDLFVMSTHANTWFYTNAAQLKDNNLDNFPWVVRASSNWTKMPFIKLGTDSNGTKYSFNAVFDVLQRSCLPTLFIGKDSDTGDGSKVVDGIVWDMADGWDSQVFAMILGGTYNSKYDNFKDGVDTLIEQMVSLPLFLDCYGNICISSDNHYIVIIPACNNQHLTSSPRFNLVTSAILNNYYNGNSENLSMMLSGTNYISEIQRPSTLGISNASTYGASAFDDADGSTIVYNTTDYDYAKVIYDEAKKQNSIYGSTGNGIEADGGEAFSKLYSFVSSGIDTRNNLRVESTGGGDRSSWWDQFDGTWTDIWDINSTQDNRGKLDADNLINYTYDACQVVANAFGNHSSDTLDWIYTDSSSNPQSSILGETTYSSNYLAYSDSSTWYLQTPNGSNGTGHISEGGLIDSNGEAANGAIKGFVNFYFKFLNSNSSISTFDEKQKNSSDEVTAFRSHVETAKHYFAAITQAFHAVPNVNAASGFSDDAKISKTFLHYLTEVSTKYGWKRSVTPTLDMYNSLASENIYSAGGGGFDKYDDYLMNFEAFGGSEIDKLVVEKTFASISKVATGNSAIQKASNYLNLAAGTNFAAAATWIYITYLDFYGIIKNPSSDSYFDEELFKLMDYAVMGEISADSVFGAEAISEEQKQKQVLNYTYMMLNPTEGREYRNTLISNGLKSWIYEEYNDICYGGGTSSTFEKATSTGSTGFLHISSYEDNFMTSWVISNYSRIVAIVLIALVIILIVIGTIKGKKIGWYIVSILTLAIMFVIAPSSGEITPYICEKMVQSMFSSNMQYWSLSENIENYTTDSQLANTEEAEVLQWIGMLKVTQLNKTIMIKKDISKKIIETISVSYAELQELQSTRWLLPTIIKQISADDGSLNYVYVSLTDLYQDMTDLYLYYHVNYSVAGTHIKTGKTELVEKTVIKDSSTSGINPTASKVMIEQVVASSIAEYTDGIREYINSNDLKKVDGDYCDLTYGNSTVQTGNTAAESLDRIEAKYKDLIPRSVTLANVADRIISGNVSHTWFYYLMNSQEALNAGSGGATIQTLPNLSNNRSLTSEKFEEYATNLNNYWTNGQIAKYKAKTTQLIIDASDYNHQDEECGGVKQSFGYLWSTETLAPYFYFNIHDLFNDSNGDRTTGFLIQQLQGNVIDEDGKDKRQTFMHYSTTGYTRDFLDLETIFTNMIPYMYKMMITAGGENGENGLLGDELIGDTYSVYKNSLKAWMYRSNWVTKLVEARQYEKEVTIGMYDSYEYKKNAKGELELTPVGEKKTINIVNSIFPQNYPNNSKTTNIVDDVCAGNTGTINGYRPMVFSEAQMHQLGLDEVDLSEIELACIATNKEVEQKWTYMINYANATGLTTEVMYRQMAMDALLIFNNNVQPDNFISSAMALYPNSYDLRSINFDSVIKLLIMSDTNDSTYIYQDSIYAVIESEGSLTGMLLLITAWICNIMVPLVRTVVLGLIFYISIVSCFYNMLSDSKERTKQIAGAVVYNLLFALLTMAYYAIYYLFITTSSADEVLSVTKVSAGTSIASWKFIVLFVASIAYAVGICVFLWKLLKNYKDMAFSLVKQYGSSLVNGVNNVVSNIKDRIAGDEGAGSNVVNNSSSVDVNTNDNQETLITNDSNNPVPVNLGDKDSADVDIDINNISVSDGDSGYIGNSRDSEVETFDIDKIIEESRNNK